MRALVALLGLVLCLPLGCGKRGSSKTQTKTEPKENATPKAEPKVEVKKPGPPKAAPNKLIANPIVENVVRDTAGKPTGELTKADLEKVKELNLYYNQLTDVKGLEKLTKLEELYLQNSKLTKAQIDELQKALPKCKIVHDSKK